MEELRSRRDSFYANIVIQSVADVFNILPWNILAKDNTDNVAKARSLAAYLLTKKMSKRKTLRALHRTNNQILNYSLEQAEHFTTTDPDYREKVVKVTKKIQERTKAK